MYSTYGGGEHSHLCLICSPATYATLVLGNTPYIKPPNPRRLIIEGNEMQYQIAQCWEKHEEALRLFQEYLGVEQALIQQIVAAIEPKYLKVLQNLVTNKKFQFIPTIFTFFFETYSDVTPQELRYSTTHVEAMNILPNELANSVGIGADQSFSSTFHLINWRKKERGVRVSRGEALL